MINIMMKQLSSIHIKSMFRRNVNIIIYKMNL